jgi:hypothetical protein
MPNDHARAIRDIFDEGEVREVLSRSFYRPDGEVQPLAAKDPRGSRRRRAAKPKPSHYEIICISLYNEDLERLDQKVAALKARGHRRMTRSALIRWALDQVDLDRVPRGI